MKALILALVLLPTTDVGEDIRQSIEETGVYIGAYYGCYESKEDGLVCILPPKQEDEENG